MRVQGLVTAVRIRGGVGGGEGRGTVVYTHTCTVIYTSRLSTQVLS